MMRYFPALFIPLLLAITCNARIIFVDSNANGLNNGTTWQDAYRLIQDAVDDSNEGDTVLVYPGLYDETVKYRGKNIVLKSIRPEDPNIVSSTIINKSVWFRGDEDANCILSGFRVNSYLYPNIRGTTGTQHTHATINCCILSGKPGPMGVVIENCDGVINNCLISDNWPVGDVLSDPIVRCHGYIKNCTIANNRLYGIYVGQGGTTTIENCVIYNNDSELWQIYVDEMGTLNVFYSDIQHGINGIVSGGSLNWGLGNIDNDPYFVRLGNHELRIIGDYHLQSQAGRWDPNTQTWVIDSNTSPCIDAGDWATPIGFEPFPSGGRINMGTYGGTTEASKSYFGKPPCQIIIAGDVNGDCIVDLKDFSIMALHWLEEG